eukprot:3311729-Rhodomonas_salina.1
MLHAGRLHRQDGKLAKGLKGDRDSERSLPVSSTPGPSLGGPLSASAGASGGLGPGSESTASRLSVTHWQA